MKKRKKEKSEFFLILHNIRSSHNVGSIFRTSDALGIKKIFLTGYTPSPIDKFGRKVKEVSKTALGAEDFIEWEKSDISKVFRKLKQEKIQILAIEQNKKSKDYRKVRVGKKVAFIVGNEVRGLSRQILSKCDLITEIPMLGQKESLNVSVAVAVALFRIIDP